MAYQAVLFDMDGVLIDTHETVTRFWVNLAREHRVELSPSNFDQHIYGTPAIHTLNVLFSKLSAVQHQSVLEDLERYETGQSYTAVPGVIPFLRTLKQHNIPTALVTSAEPRKVNDVLSQLDVTGLFMATITVFDVKQGKPHPDGYLAAAQNLNVRPEHCIVFEDAISGVKAAVDAGALCIGVKASSSGSLLLEAGAQHVIPDFAAVGVEIAASDISIGAELRLCLDSDYTLALSSKAVD